jgi:pantothenate kinase type III
VTTVLALLSLLGVAVLVGAVCGFVAGMRGTLRSAERSVRGIAAHARSMRDDGAAISPGIESMNQNLYRVAVHLSQLGEAAEQLSAPVAEPVTKRG